MKKTKTKKALLLGAAICLSASGMFAQPWNKNLQTISASYGEEVIRDAAGNYVFVGKTGVNMYVTKTNVNGNVLWQKYYGSTYSSGPNAGYSICQLNDGNYVIGGQFTPNVTGAQDIAFLLKIDANGNGLISKEFVANYNCFPCPPASAVNSIRATSDGGFICCGKSTSFQFGFIMKGDVNLNITWIKYLNLVNPLLNIENISGGGYIGCGEEGIYKFDASGNIVWAKRYDFGSYEFWNSVKQTTDGGYIFSGSSTGGYAFVMKTDANGIAQWQYKMTSSITLSSYSVLQTSDGGYAVGINSAVTSIPSPYPAIVKFQSNGTFSWAKSYIGSVKRLMQTIDSYGTHLVVTGNTTAWSLTPGIYLFKTDVNGVNCISQTVSVTLDGSDLSAPTNISTTANSYTQDYSAYTLTQGNSTLTLNSNCCIANAGINKSNTNQPCCSPVCTAVQIGTAALPGYTYSWTPITGLSCTNCAQPNASPCSTTIYTVTASAGGTCFGNTDAVKVTTNASVGCCGPPDGPHGGRNASTEEELSLFDLNVFPNPSTGLITVEFGNNIVTLIQITDLTGRIIYENKNIMEKTLSVDLSEQAKGIYLLRAITDLEEINRKITLE